MRLSSLLCCISDQVTSDEEPSQTTIKVSVDDFRVQSTVDFGIGKTSDQTSD